MKLGCSAAARGQTTQVEWAPQTQSSRRSLIPEFSCLEKARVKVPIHILRHVGFLKPELFDIRFDDSGVWSGSDWNLGGHVVFDHPVEREVIGNFQMFLVSAARQMRLAPRQSKRLFQSPDKVLQGCAF